MADPELQKILKTNKENWNGQLEDLARHLCIERGDDPDSRDWPGVQLLNWQMFVSDAEDYLRRRAMNKYYWEYLANHDQSSGS